MPTTARLTRTWIGLIALTLASVAAGWLAPMTAPRLGVVTVVLALTAVKARLILHNFLNLRAAPRGWQLVFTVYLVIVMALILLAEVASDWLQCP